MRECSKDHRPIQWDADELVDCPVCVSLEAVSRLERNVKAVEQLRAADVLKARRCKQVLNSLSKAAIALVQAVKKGNKDVSEEIVWVQETLREIV